ncbi:hypothetical protein Cni_G14411 [Canna indica]|uniref:F-box domain-containing protein n=1 Tax=Canna indica TaxID=4628 RepID=A0AAQ3KC57_9LILI|nr:hypothetical protein Cni_G14411 [Canna indica]
MLTAPTGSTGWGHKTLLDEINGRRSHADMDEHVEKTRSWDEMPADCLVSIFSHLPLDDLAISVPFVCKSWRRTSTDASCWKLLNFQDLNFLPWSNFATRFIIQFSSSSSLSPPTLPSSFSFSGFMKLAVARSQRSAVELRFPRSFGPSFQDLLYASNECPRLRVLRMPDLSVDDEVHIPELVGKWRELESLDLETKPSTFLRMVSEISSNCKNFTALTMSGSIKNEDAIAMANSLPELKFLELRKSYVTKKALMAIMNGCKNLERLSVRDCLGFEPDEEVLRKGSDIEHFEHEGSKLLDDNGYETDEADLHHGYFLFI